MENLSLCFHAIGPLLLLILLGYYLKRIHFIPKAGFDALDKLCFRIFIPVMLFYNVYTADFSTAFHFPAIAYMVSAMVITFFAAFFLIPRLIPGRNADIATVIQGVCHGNLAVLGMPLITTLFGEGDAAVYSIMLACSSPLMNPLIVYERVHFQGDTVRFRDLLRKVFTSPYLVGTLAGIGIYNAVVTLIRFG